MLSKAELPNGKVYFWLTHFGFVPTNAHVAGKDSQLMQYRHPSQESLRGIAQNLPLRYERWGEGGSL